MDVLTTPRVAADGLIELDVVPTITEFEGFVELGESLAPASPKTAGPLLVGVPDSNAPCRPVFSVRSLAATIPRLQSGQTVVLRGADRNDISRTDKAGFDGLEVEESTIDSEPVSLLIFVTASSVPGTAIPAQP